MDKEEVIHTPHTYTYTVDYYSAIIKNEILPFAMAWMELESIMISKPVRERQIPYDFTHMWNLRNKTSKEKKKREKDKKIDS